MAERRLLVVTSCTSSKADLPSGVVVPAERLYRGEQHRRLMRGVAAFRAAVSDVELDLWIVSAGHGLIRATDPVSSYDKTFGGMPMAAVDTRASELGVEDDLAATVAAPYSLGLFLLGSDYLRAAGLSQSSSFAGPTLVFCGEAAAQRLRGTRNLRCVPAGKREARRFSCGLVGLKGEMAGRLLEILATQPDRIEDVGHTRVAAVLELIDSRPGQFAVAA